MEKKGLVCDQKVLDDEAKTLVIKLTAEMDITPKQALQMNCDFTNVRSAWDGK